MELALYCPVYGYYEKEADKVGKRGDFFTSVSVGPMFGQLLAFQFAGWIDELARDSGSVRLVEAGAHTGQLAQDILTWLRIRRASICERIDYWIVEPSSRRREWQERTLAEFAGKINWASGIDQLPDELPAIIFSNELLDAMPAHRFVWDAHANAWFEWGVSVEGDQAHWVKAPPGTLSDASPPAIPDEIREPLAHGFTVETCPAAEAWWAGASTRLSRGKLLAIDYGLRAEEFFSPHRSQGTLRGYSMHRPRADILSEPGNLDITAHVNFTAIQRAGEAKGLRTEEMTSQERFLIGIAGRMEKTGDSDRQWTAQEVRQFQTLTHPEHLGRAFKVLVQSR